MRQQLGSMVLLCIANTVAIKLSAAGSNCVEAGGSASKFTYLAHGRSAL